MSVLQKSNKRLSSRRQIQIKGVRDGVLLLPHNQFRLVLEVSSINFELKSEDEQDAIIDAYQSFLNSLPCPLQIITRIREVDIAQYLEEFSERADKEGEEVYREQIHAYTRFVQELVVTNKILSRRFYVIIPLTDRDNSEFASVHEQLRLYADIVSKGLSRLGIQSRALTSLEILDLFYGFYNAELAKSQPLTLQTLRLLKESLL